MIGRRWRRFRQRWAPRIVGISMVRDEADIVRISVLHHLSLGLAEILVLDNGSSDGTEGVLVELARRHPVRWTRDASGYRQAELVTGLAREAHRRGATWILPFDADELWFADGRRLPAFLAGTTASGLACEVRTFVQARNAAVSHEGSLLSMTRRTPAPEGLYEDAEQRVEAREIAFVEMPYPRKLITRATSTLELAPGAHLAAGLEGAVSETSAVVCLHAPLRSRAALDRKAEDGRRSDAAGLEPGINWHLRRWARLAEEGPLDDEWAANSYATDGCLDVDGRRPRLVTDGTLAKLAARAR
jgi:hypothetical protein